MASRTHPTHEQCGKTADRGPGTSRSLTPSSVFCLLSWVLCPLSGLLLDGCGASTGYTNASLFPTDVNSVYLEMFDNRTFRRGIEFTLSDALAKRIEANTPYKIVSNRDQADSVIGGQIVTASESILTIERNLGRALEKDVAVTTVVNWKNLKDGKLMINSRSVSATATYSEFQGQDFTYASTVVANKLAQGIVQLMENQW
ncbi:MAG: LPS assembly lipoprotein LptE [Planctomycetes bacterium]|nr:LPS assembly lipoprotein LptE [Planctomycetota bacterium]